jgi:two-component system sensor histidine kinase PilS (NtrC family)
VVPPVLTLLRWLYIGRLSIVTGVFFGAVFSWWVADITQLFIASVSATLAFIFTMWAVWYSHLRTGVISQTFLYAQAVFDLGLVTAIVHISGPYTYFAALYILVISINAVMMPFANGMLVALMAGILYAGDVVFGHPVDLSPALLLQVGVYWMVAIATGYLASRVRVAGQVQEALTADLRRARLETADILRNIKTGILTIASDGRLLYANPTAELLLGLDNESQGGLPVLDLLGSVAPALADAVRSTAQSGSRVRRREGIATVSGRSYPFGVSTTATMGQPGQTASVTAIFNDISDQKRLEHLHMRTERLEAVAEIAASLAHEIRNPLASIRSAVEMLARAARDDPDEKTLAGLVLRESDRLSRILTEFLDFSRVRVTKSAPLDLVSVAEAGIRLARQHPECVADATIEMVAPHGPVLVEGDEDLLHRVVFNLVLNAVQVSGGTARIIVEVAIADPAELDTPLPIEQPRMVRVSDNGPGVAPALLERVFEPFVTGRPGGSGLGLAIVQRAVQAHRGYILCDSTPGEGTVFTIFIPARFAAEEGR